MKKSLAIILLLFITVAIFAQTQQGYVKTKGRMINGKYVPGSGLVGATVTVKGRSALTVQNKNGLFSFVVPAQQFTVQSVQKKGYEIIDNDVFRRVYNYSKNPIYLVMETPDRQMEDLLDEKEKMRNQFNEQLKKARAEIKKLRDENRISQEEYNRRLQQILDNQNNSEKHISELAQYYATLDYDQMDEKDRVIEDCINNGEFERADSLIRSKGDLQSRHDEVMREKELEEQREKELEKQQQELADSKEGTRKKMEALAEDYYRLFNLAKATLQFDSAAFYIEKRVELDYENALWQFNASQYFQEQNQYSKAISHAEKALNLYQRMEKDNPKVYEVCLAATMNNIANLYSQSQRFSECEQLYKQALEIRERLAKGNQHTFKADVAMTMNNLAIFYKHTQRFTESEKMYKQALDINIQLAKDNAIIYMPSVAMTINNLAILYSDTQRLQESEKMYKQALEIYQGLAKQKPKNYEPYVALTMNNIANLHNHYHHQDTLRLYESETYYKQAMDIYQRLATENAQAYEPDLAMIKNNLASLYSKARRLDESEQMQIQAMEIYIRLAKDNPQNYEPKVAICMNNLAGLYQQTQQLSKSEKMFQEVMGIFQRLAMDNPQTYEPSLAMTMSNLAIIYRVTNQLTESEQMSMQALTIYRRLAESNPHAYEPDVAFEIRSLGNLHYINHQFFRSEQMWKQALDIYLKLAKDNPQAYKPDVAMTMKNLAYLYSNTQRFTECEQMYSQALDVYLQLAKDSPTNYKVDVAQTMNDISYVYTITKKFSLAEQYAQECLLISPQLTIANANLAAAQLLLGKYDEAKAIYLQYKDELKDCFLTDLQAFEEAGIVPEDRKEDVKKIRQLLTE